MLSGVRDSVRIVSVFSLEFSDVDELEVLLLGLPGKLGV